MTSIYDIQYEDIEKFLLANNQNFLDKDDAYNKTLILLKDKKSYRSFYKYYRMDDSS
jgi:hypothetical protein